MVVVSFAKPDCFYTKGSLALSGTGLQFSSTGAVVKAGIAALKAAQPNTRVLLAVGGATYYNFAQLNVQCVRDIVDDFGFDGEAPRRQCLLCHCACTCAASSWPHCLALLTPACLPATTTTAAGVDLDYEPGTPSCSNSGGTMRCSTDEESVSVAAALRMELPKGRYLLSTATWHVGMYGEGAFAAARPASIFTGINLALAKSGAGQSLDLINIMAYDAGNVGSTGFDWRCVRMQTAPPLRVVVVAVPLLLTCCSLHLCPCSESYRAHRAHWQTQAVAIGIEIPPEAW